MSKLMSAATSHVDIRMLHMARGRRAESLALVLSSEFGVHPAVFLGIKNQERRTKGEGYARLDPATYTPWNTVLTGEETTGGRLFDIHNPFADSAADAEVRWLSKVPA